VEVYDRFVDQPDAVFPRLAEGIRARSRNLVRVAG
jgi:hypothetical protein